MSAYFVTATGTDIGKTFVTAGLIRHLRAEEKAVSALKPVVSGFDDATRDASDPGQLLAALGGTVTDEAFARMSPWRFAAPLSPDMAAAREGRQIEFDALVKMCREAVAAHTDTGTLFIEGVGGIMVPLDSQHTVLDWMRALELPLILVAGSYLGSISHTLTALGMIAQARLKVAALVINESVGDAVPVDDTISTIRRFAPGIVIASIARLRSAEAARGDFAKLAAVL